MSDREPIQRLLSVDEISALTGASPSFWRRQIRKRTIRSVHVGDLVRIAAADLAEWLDARTAPADQAATPEARK